MLEENSRARRGHGHRHRETQIINDERWKKRRQSRWRIDDDATTFSSPHALFVRVHAPDECRWRGVLGHEFGDEVFDNGRGDWSVWFAPTSSKTGVFAGVVGRDARALELRVERELFTSRRRLSVGTKRSAVRFCRSVRWRRIGVRRRMHFWARVERRRETLEEKFSGREHICDCWHDHRERFRYRGCDGCGVDDSWKKDVGLGTFFREDVLQRGCNRAVGCDSVLRGIRQGENCDEVRVDRVSSRIDRRRFVRVLLVYQW